MAIKFQVSLATMFSSKYFKHGLTFVKPIIEPFMHFQQNWNYISKPNGNFEIKLCQKLHNHLLYSIKCSGVVVMVNAKQKHLVCKNVTSNYNL